MSPERRGTRNAIEVRYMKINIVCRVSELQFGSSLRRCLHSCIVVGLSLDKSSFIRGTWMFGRLVVL